MATTVEILQPFYENEFRQAPKDSAARSSAQDKAKRKAKKMLNRRHRLCNLGYENNTSSRTGQDRNKCRTTIYRLPMDV